jgi:hypothetical protein
MSVRMFQLLNYWMDLDEVLCFTEYFRRISFCSVLSKLTPALDLHEAENVAN